MSSSSWNWLLVFTIAITFSQAKGTYYYGYDPAPTTESPACPSYITSNKNVKFTASTSSHGPGHPKINSNDVWCAATINKQQYLIVDLGGVVTIDQLAVQGKASTKKSVSSYYVKTSKDGFTFSYILDESGSRPEAFWGKIKNGDDVAKTVLKKPVNARYVLFNPREPLTASNGLCLRVDVNLCAGDLTPINGRWTTWSSWSGCSQQCNIYGQGSGYGIRSRYRSCTNPIPTFQGAACRGNSGEDGFCPNGCASQVNGQWGHWSQWSGCSKTCGDGTATRTRKCNNPPPSGGGSSCTGDAKQTKDCSDRLHCPINGAWSHWSNFGGCSVSCGGGRQTRHRICNNPQPQHGGHDCAGNDFDHQNCNSDPCPINGGWTHWQSWSGCSATCGGGSQTRKRSCNDPPPQHGGHQCSGSDTDRQSCNTQNCPVNGGWTQWTQWSACDKTCGGGNSNRHRQCTNPPPQNGGKTCPGNKNEYRSCNSQGCPVNGGWSAWGQWSGCSKTCDGQRTRHRSCTNPSPSNHGASCPGSRVQSEACNVGKCPGPVDGSWTAWSEWSTCTKSCSGGTQRRTRSCTNPKPAHGGKSCVGGTEESQQCNKQACPVDGGWTPWNSWTECSATCGGGTRSRTRACTNPPPSGDGSGCIGSYVEVEQCKTHSCPVNGKFSPWTQWQQCSKTCGGGTQTRTRRCDSPSPSNGGKACTGDTFQTRECNTNTCPVDGMWSNWASWTVCSRTCGGGTQSRMRQCDSPQPSNGGKRCLGHDTETRECKTQTCPVDGGWTPWATGPCNVLCGDGKRNRTRTCTNPPASGGGDDCMGTTFETENCNPGPCKTTPTPTATAVPTPTIDPNIPKIDLVFALSATSVSSSLSYELMRNTIKRFIDRYGVNNIHYSIIVYGNQVVRVVNFNRTFPLSANELKIAIDKQPALSGGPVLINALQEAYRVFKESVGRPGAKKVLVVMTDKNSGSRPNFLSQAVRPLEDLGVLVISVGVGDGVSRSELSIISPNPLDVISARLSINPSVLAVRIMERILKLNFPDVDVGFAISAASANSDEIFSLMKEIINTIIDRYGVNKVRFSFIIYGSRVTTRFTFDNAPITQEELIKAVNGTDKVTGDPDLEKALEEAEKLFTKSSRPNATKVFVVLSDIVGAGDDNSLIANAARLRKRGVLILSVGFGQQVNAIGNQMTKVVITQSDYIRVPDLTTQRPVVIAETIMFKALQANIPEIDLTFVISATSDLADRTFTLMKSTINSIIEKYGIVRIHYTVIVFGSDFTRSFDFSTNVPNKTTLIRLLTRLQRETGTPDLEKALQEVKKVYELREVRPNAKKVVVVILDEKSVNTEVQVKTAVTDLVQKNVLVIGVGVGGSVDRNELIYITEENRNIIEVEPTERPEEVAREIMSIILRTSGYSQWSEWGACSRTCRQRGVAGTRQRTRTCVIPELGCDGPRQNFEECNKIDCEGCGERTQLSDSNYSASTAVQPASFAKLDTSNPSASQRAWCRNANEVGGYLQIDLGETADVYQVATKGQEQNDRWVRSYYITLSSDGNSFFNYTQGGRTKAFSGNRDSRSVVFNNINASQAVRYVRFHPITFNEQPCMQASVFACTESSTPTVASAQISEEAGNGVLIALWILAGILTFLLLLACLYYCCWHVCCKRGKKRKGLAAFREETSTEEDGGYLIEDGESKRRNLPAVAMVPRVPKVDKVPEDEVQEVSIEMKEDSAQLGVIQFGIEADNTKDQHVTAETVHSETPLYSQEVNTGTVKKGASKMTMSSTDTQKRKRAQSESAAATLGVAEATSHQWSHQTEQKQSSTFTNEGYMRSQESIEPTQVHSRTQELRRAQSADELSTIDYDMFAQRRESAQSIVKGGRGQDGYMRMKQSSRGSSIDVTDGGIQMGTVDVAIGGIGAPNVRRGSSQFYGMEEQEMTFSADNGGRHYYELEDGGYRTEEWYTRGGHEPGRLREEGFREIHVEHQPIYHETENVNQGFRHSRLV
ncbi:coadhesin-like [Stylophora pistillata]|uniref:coadhesin-like n=1 Tax=Stylophora pistillata TaxID=50429 RepID=UPI000C041836|nr:coadhesin-like [Stylophora pistillata]